jgi:urease alpha subunit
VPVNRLSWAVLAAGLATLAAGIALIVAGQTGDSSSTIAAAVVPGASDVRALLDGIPQSGVVLGDPSARSPSSSGAISSVRTAASGS